MIAQPAGQMPFRISTSIAAVAYSLIVVASGFYWSAAFQAARSLSVHSIARSEVDRLEMTAGFLLIFQLAALVPLALAALRPRQAVEPVENKRKAAAANRNLAPRGLRFLMPVVVFGLCAWGCLVLARIANIASQIELLSSS